MSSLTAFMVIAAVVLAATALGIVCRRTQLRVSAPREQATEIVTAQALGLPSDTQFGHNATLIQFSTQFCSKCPGTARLLSSEAANLDGVNHIEIDLTDNIDVARAFNILQTPTTLVLDARGQIRSRITGAPTVAVIRDELHKADALPYHVDRIETAS